MRLPPANGFAGSAVWQLAQSPASVSALPCAMISAEGSARHSPETNAVHKRKQARIARMVDVVPAPIDPSRRYSAKASVTRAPRHFAPGLPDDTNRIGAWLFPTRNCDLRKPGSIAQICSAREEK